MSSEALVVDMKTAFDAATPEGTIIADGALDSMVGKTVPVTLGENKTVVGEAEMFKDAEGNIMASITFVL